MNCTSCGGGLEWAGGGQYARCTRCQQLFAREGQGLKPIVVQAPGGGNNPEFNAMFAQQLGFGPPQRAAQAPQQGYGGGSQPIATYNEAGVQVELHFDTKKAEDRLMQKASSMVWGWIIGAIILLIVIGVLAGIGIYGYVKAKESMAGVGAAGGGLPAKTAQAQKWDGKSTFTCTGNDAVKLEGITAKVDTGPAIRADANCQLTLDNVNITSPTGIESSGNAQVTMTGGSITASGTAIDAQALSKVKVSGATVKGKVKQAGLAKIDGVPVTK